MATRLLVPVLVVVLSACGGEEGDSGSSENAISALSPATASAPASTAAQPVEKQPSEDPAAPPEQQPATQPDAGTAPIQYCVGGDSPCPPPIQDGSCAAGSDAFRDEIYLCQQGIGYAPDETVDGKSLREHANKWCYCLVGIRAQRMTCPSIHYVDTLPSTSTPEEVAACAGAFEDPAPVDAGTPAPTPTPAPDPETSIDSGTP